MWCRDEIEICREERLLHDSQMECQAHPRSYAPHMRRFFSLKNEGIESLRFTRSDLANFVKAMRKKPYRRRDTRI
ncbi:hypothetical protein LINPERPRIM_LOCUS25626 [Linum perenne]